MQGHMSRAVWLLSLVQLTFLPACELKGKNEVSRRLVRPVSVQVQGRVLDAETMQPLAEIAVTLQRRALPNNDDAEAADASAPSAASEKADTAEEVKEVSAKSDAEGAFTLDAELDIEAYDYNLMVNDPKGRYAENAAFRVYSGSDATLVAGTLLLYPAKGELLVDVRGRIRSAVGGSQGSKALAGASVGLVDQTNGARYSATTDEEGRYALTRLPLRDFVLEVDSPPEDSAQVFRLLPTYARPYSLASEPQTKDETTGAAIVTLPTVHMPATVIQEKGELPRGAGLTVVLSWEADTTACKDGAELHAELSLPGPGCDTNHLGGKEIRLPRSDGLNPGEFGSGTCLWPRNYGGADALVLGKDAAAKSLPTPLRVALGSDLRLHSLMPLEEESCPDLSGLLAEGTEAADDTCATAFYGHLGTKAGEPEILRVARGPLTTTLPRELGYYYEAPSGTSGEVSRRYPMGFGELRVSASAACGLNNVRALVEVYDDGALLGRFERLGGSSGGQSTAAWTPFVLEVGSSRPSAESRADHYFRLRPLDSTPAVASVQSYFFQDVATQVASEEGCDPDGFAPEVPVAERTCKRPLTNATRAIPIGTSDLAILGESVSISAGMRTRRAGVYEQTSPGQWTFYPFTGDDIGSGNGALVQVFDVLAAGFGDEVIIGTPAAIQNRSNDNPDMGGDPGMGGDPDMGGGGMEFFTRFRNPYTCAEKDEVVGIASAQSGAALLVATKNQLWWLDPTNVEEGKPPCIALDGGTFEYSGLDLDIEWMGRSEKTGKLMLLAGPNVYTLGSVTKDQGVKNVRIYASYFGWPTNVYEDGAALWMGTGKGVAVAQVDPQPGKDGAGGAEVFDCGVSLDSGGRLRNDASSLKVQAVTRYGSRMIVGTPQGLAYTRALTESDPRRDPNNPDYDDGKTCLEWFPTEPIEGRPPPFPEGVDVRDLLVVDGELHVLTAERGLFRLRGGL